MPSTATRTNDVNPAKPPLPRTEDIIRALRMHLPEMRERYGISYLGIFGSYVRGEQKRRSDLDVLVEFNRPPTLFEFIAIEQYLSELTGVKVDLVMKKVLKPNIGHHILREVVPL